MGIAGIVDSWPELIPLIQSGRIKGEGVFTHHFDLAEGAEAYRMFNAHAVRVSSLAPGLVLTKLTVKFLRVGFSLTLNER